MKNKKGFLLAEETLKIILAVISIGFLVYFLTALYFANQKNEDLEQAEASLERIEKIINSVGEKSESQDIFPQGWYLFSFTEKGKPNSCAGKNCICICDNVLDFSNRQITECNKNGACLVVSELKKFDEIKIKNPKEGLTEILIKKQKNEILIQEK